MEVNRWPMGIMTVTVMKTTRTIKSKVGKGSEEGYEEQQFNI
jgi:hypothetical protein